MRFDCETSQLMLRSHRVKAKAKVKIFFDVCRFFFDLFYYSLIFFAFACCKQPVSNFLVAATLTDRKDNFRFAITQCDLILECVNS